MIMRVMMWAMRMERQFWIWDLGFWIEGQRLFQWKVIWICIRIQSRQSKIQNTCVRHADQEQALRRRRHAGFGSIARFKGDRGVIRRLFALSHRDKRADDVADHVVQ